MASSTVTPSASSPSAAGSPLADATARMGASYSGLFAQWFRGITINAHERLAIAHLWEHGPMTMSQLGARIPLSRAAITALTDRLETLGYVKRTADQQDRRRTVLTVTELPGRLVEPMVTDWRGKISQHSEAFSEDELAVVQRWILGVREINHAAAAELRERATDKA